MPEPTKGETKKNFLKRCIPILMQEGKDNDEAVATCMSLFEERHFKELSTEARNNLPASAFVFPIIRRYPIHDRAHAANALARASGKPEWKAVKRKVCKKYPDLPACKVTYEEEEAMWIEVFKTGTHTSGNGIVKTYTEEDLEAIAVKYNGQKEHEAPLVIGHPATDDPAFGWIKEVKRAGDKLMAFVDQVSEGVREGVKEGMFKKVSIALYPDNLLRHVGLLGATPPAVKGLAPVAFSEGVEFEEFIWATDEYRMPTVAKIFSRIRDFFIEKFGLEMADKVLDKSDIDHLMPSAASKMIPVAEASDFSDPNSNKEEEIMTKELEDKVKVLEEGMTELKTAFQELKTATTEISTKLTTTESNEVTRQKTLAMDAEKVAFAEKVEGLVRGGKILPAEKEGLLEQYADLLKLEDGVTFAEANLRPSQKLLARLEQRQVLVTQSRPFATPDKASAKDLDIQSVPVAFAEMANKLDVTSLEIDKQIRQYAEEKKVTYEEAAVAFSSSL